jgi:hypothetical protein
METDGLLLQDFSPDAPTMQSRTIGMSLWLADAEKGLGFTITFTQKG